MSATVVPDAQVELWRRCTVLTTAPARWRLATTPAWTVRRQTPGPVPHAVGNWQEVASLSAERWFDPSVQLQTDNAQREVGSIAAHRTARSMAFSQGRAGAGRST